VLLEKPKAGQPFHGFTDNYIRVEVDDPAARDNALVRVTLGDFNEEGTALKGCIINPES
jgi:threonylcarbamoyladenosine tRNA methylthiotransferase MtaB